MKNIKNIIKCIIICLFLGLIFISCEEKNDFTDDICNYETATTEEGTVEEQPDDDE
ncbi:hypothetical protein IWQ47_004327 [Aquimarina sp. EL_43]|uniref:hypothetical protein n=1 Tax=Aquimarina TaxID=290174 RepID=UPI0004ACBFE5|nr:MULTISPECIES: hypothetical protein [Aquimarina]MBG6132843.1 hypothetical protein [Aquimarina sp. EL_35]MBG6153080.1 hypothetical protein [Aquimarina sp. EL_32]MBG6171236.1 hypothetical protein [Aquimarina sp. EL_43]